MYYKHILFSAGFVLLFFTSFTKVGGDEIPVKVNDVFTKHGCLTCHAVSYRLVGPSFSIISKRQYSAEQIEKLIAAPQPLNWPGYPPMVAIQNVSGEEALIISDWLNSLNEEAEKEKK